MAGVKGRSGGARPGAGRKPKAAQEKQDEQISIATNGDQTPLEFLLAVMNDNALADKLRLDAAKTAAQYVHPKVGEGGKKEQKADAAKRASNKFAATTPPKLIVNNR